MALSNLDTKLIYLKGVGEARAELLHTELKLETFGDLFTYFPYRHIDRTTFSTIKNIHADSDSLQLKGIVKNIQVIDQKRGKRLTAMLYDGTGVIELLWFNGMSYMQKTLKPDTQYLVYGKPNFFNGHYSIMHPEIELAESSDFQFSGKMQPVYSITQKLISKNITSKVLAKFTFNLLQHIFEKDVIENLPQPIKDKYRLINRFSAYKQMHFPDDDSMLQQAIRRLKFEELFIDQIKLLRLRKFRHTASIGFIFKNIDNFFNRFYAECLPFELTGAQKRVIKEIRKDVLSGTQMNRLLQGDVGSGKTIVALLAMLMAVDNDFQACLMAPTEILAQQHFETISVLLAPLHIPIALLTGSIKGKKRKTILENLTTGGISILIGTHALIEDSVQFKNLGFVVIDEQHRFGVEQRSKLWIKNSISPHILVMTATPIPRTLAMTYYGDLDVSTIDELPPGRKEIQTLHKRDSMRLQVWAFVREQIKLGRQIYIIYPLIEESEKLDLKNLMDGYESVSRDFPAPDYRISIIHGKMKSADKDFEMQQFANKKTQILIATTVIEVGVNIPNASVMIIENAERFGLSQLHQLRGRVGRGEHQSYCILMSGDKLSSDAKTRLKIMTETNDGFKIADVDMQLRGPGEIEGTRQSGAAQFKVANLQFDESILREARITAVELLDNDPNLELLENQFLKKFISEQKWKVKKWGKVS